MARIRHQPMAAKIPGEYPLAGRNRFLLRHRAEAELRPSRLRALDDEGRSVLVELVGVRPHPAVLGLLEDECEGIVEFLVRAEPHELALAHVEVGAEALRKLAADLGIQAVRRHHQVVGACKFRSAFDLGLEAQRHAQRQRPLLQQVQQPLAPDAAEPVAGRDDALAAIVDRDVVPIGEMLADRGCAHGIVGREIVERLIGQHHPPAEGVVGPVALEHRDVVRGVAPLHADREVEARRAAAEARNLHAVPSFSPPRHGIMTPGRRYFKLEDLSLKYFRR